MNHPTVTVAPNPRLVQTIDAPTRTRLTDRAVVDERKLVITGGYRPAWDRSSNISSLGTPASWRAGTANAVVSIVELRAAGHGCEFALHASTVELDSRTSRVSLELRVGLEPVACARCGTTLFQGAAPARHYALERCTLCDGLNKQPQPARRRRNLEHWITRTPGRTSRIRAIQHDELYLHITGTLPPGTLDTVPGEDDGYLAASTASLTVIAQLHRHDAEPGNATRQHLAAN